jgi:uncharacterized protein
MTSSRTDGRRRPPPRVERLVTEYVDMIALVRKRAPRAQSLIIGGKSLGGRVASLIAAGAAAPVAVDGLVCLGYPFHPPAQPERLRTAHLETLDLPSLIVQGERDPFGTRAEIEGYGLSPAVRLVWIGDGDHDFGPRGRSPYTRQGNLAAAADAVADYAANIVQRSG